MKKLTSDQVFARWWAKRKPSAGYVKYYQLSAEDERRVRDWARIAFYRGYNLGRTRALERQR